MAKFRNRLKRLTPGPAAAIGVAVLAGALMFRAFDPGVLQDMRLAAFDAYQRTAPRTYQQAPVRVVDIDEGSLQRFGQWPWSRRRVAQLIDKLNGYGAAAIGLDVVFAEPDRASPARLQKELIAEGLTPPADPAQPWPDYDRELADAFARARVVTSFGLHGEPNAAEPALKPGLAFVGRDASAALTRYPGAVINLPALEGAAKGNGSFSVVSKTDKVIRTVPLLAQLRDTVYPSLSLELLRVAQGASSITVKSTAAGRVVGGADGVESVRVGALTIPLNRDGQIWTHYAGPVPDRMVPAWRILEDEANALTPRFKGHIVLIGSSAVGLVDLRATPLNPFEPGVNIHAEVLEQILLKDYLTRPLWSSAAEAGMAALAALLVLLALARFGGGAGAAAGLIGIAGQFGASAAAYGEAGLLIDATFPAAATLAVYLAAATLAFLKTEREKGQIRNAFGQYLSPGLVSQIADRPESLSLGGEARDMTFLFTDLEGFTSLTEGMEPSQLVEILNEYLDGLCSIVMEHGGAIDKIVGDAVHGMFNAPVAMEDHPERAVRCALAMDAFAMGFIAKLAADGIKLGVTRIGVNTGVAVVGNFGGEKRFDYTAHGDAINTAARLEAANKPLGTRICIAESAASRCPNMSFRPIGVLMLKGKENGVFCMEPVVDGQMTAEELDAYREAWTLMETDEARAAEIFADLARRRPEDALAALQAKRAERGEATGPISLAG